MYVSVNISPMHIVDGATKRLFERAPLERIVLEIPEHSAVN